MKLESGMRLATSHSFKEGNVLLDREFRVREYVGE